MTTAKNRITGRSNTATTAPATRAESVVSAVERITPESAAKMLVGNTRNRALVQARVIAMAEDMVAGRWRTTHQGVAIATDGTLLDGQHRLNAIILANVAVDMVVTRGLAVESIDAIDIGEKRRAHDVMAIADGVHLSRAQRAAVCVAAQLVSDGSLLKYGEKQTVNSLRAAWKEHGKDASAVLAALVVGRRHNRLETAAVVGSLTIAHRTNPVKVVEFCELMRTGANLREGHPALTLRNFVLTTSTSGGVAYRDDMSSRTFGLFDSFVCGETRKRTQRSDATRARYLEPWAKRVEK